MQDINFLLLGILLVGLFELGVFSEPNGNQQRCIPDHKTYCHNKRPGFKFTDGCHDCRCTHKTPECLPGECTYGPRFNETFENFCVRLMSINNVEYQRYTELVPLHNLKHEIHAHNKIKAAASKPLVVRSNVQGKFVHKRVRPDMSANSLTESQPYYNKKINMKEFQRYLDRVKQMSKAEEDSEYEDYLNENDNGPQMWDDQDQYGDRPEEIFPARMEQSHDGMFDHDGGYGDAYSHEGRSDNWEPEKHGLSMISGASNLQYSGGSKSGGSKQQSSGKSNDGKDLLSILSKMLDGDSGKKSGVGKYQKPGYTTDNKEISSYEDVLHHSDKKLMNMQKGEGHRWHHAYDRPGKGHHGGKGAHHGMGHHGGKGGHHGRHHGGKGGHHGGKGGHGHHGRHHGGKGGHHGRGHHGGKGGHGHHGGKGGHHGMGRHGGKGHHGRHHGGKSGPHGGKGGHHGMGRHGGKGGHHGRHHGSKGGRHGRRHHGGKGSHHGRHHGGKGRHHGWKGHHGHWGKGRHHGGKGGHHGMRHGHKGGRHHGWSKGHHGRGMHHGGKGWKGHHGGKGGGRHGWKGHHGHGMRHGGKGGYHHGGRHHGKGGRHHGMHRRGGYHGGKGGHGHHGRHHGGKGGHHGRGHHGGKGGHGHHGRHHGGKGGHHGHGMHHGKGGKGGPRGKSHQKKKSSVLAKASIMSGYPSVMGAGSMSSSVEDDVDENKQLMSKLFKEAQRLNKELRQVAKRLENCEKYRGALRKELKNLADKKNK